MDDIVKQIILEKIRVSLEDYKIHADELLKIINIHFAKENDRLRNIAILNLQRYYSGLICVTTLIKEYKFYKPIEFNYILILRALTLDFITLEYLKSQHDLGNDKFNEASKKINNISAIETYRYCDNIEDKYREPFREFVAKNIFPENYSFDESRNKFILKNSNSISPWKMAEYFKDKKNTFAFDAYKLYANFSLVEHFNNLTFSAMKGETNTNLNNMLWAMYYIFHGHYTCFEILDFFPKHTSEIVEKRNYFLSLLHEV